MPHYRDGRPVQEGDTVIVRAVVKTVYQTEDYCNAIIETIEKMHPSRERGESITLNTKQLDYVASVPKIPEPMSPVGDLYVEMHVSGDDNE